jgi:predicted CXXCH cytochrome family protein
VLLVVLIALLDLYVLRGPAQRSMISRDLECLRCHAEVLPPVAAASVHFPFEREQCTSCHTRHGKRDTVVWRRGDYSAFRWLEVVLDRVSLQIVWNFLTRPEKGGSVEMGKKASVETTDTSQPSQLIAKRERLCWTCHGDLGPQMGMANRHQPFVQGQCMSCHDAHWSGNQKTLLVEKPEVLCMMCHEKLTKAMQADNSHPPFKQRKCLECHAPHASNNVAMFRASPMDVCTGCHAPGAIGLTAATVHSPVEKGLCLACHGGHGTGQPNLLVAEGKSLCYKCHTDIKRTYTTMSAHTVPCTRCHKVHGSSFSFLLVSAERPLCLGCHTGVADQLTMPVTHYPAEKDNCTRCHNPHGTPYKPMLVKDQISLCRGCHPVYRDSGTPANPHLAQIRSTLASLTSTFSNESAESAELKVKVSPQRMKFAVAVGQSAPVGSSIPRADLQASLYPPAGRPKGTDPVTNPYKGPWPNTYTSSHPVGDIKTWDGKKEMLCTECHFAHASQYEYVLRLPTTELCQQCHAVEVTSLSQTAHVIIPCYDCHIAHQADYVHLLRERQPNLCLECHSTKTYYTMSHSVGGKNWDYLAKSQLSCTSSCHNPHGTRHVSMLRVPYNEDGYGTDYICLRCHTKVGIRY